MLPSCARTNVWWNCLCEGEKIGTLLFHQKYRVELTTKDQVKIILNTLKNVKAKDFFSFKSIKQSYKEQNSKKVSKEIMSYDEISKFYTDFYLYGMITKGTINRLDAKRIHYMYTNQLCAIKSLYSYQVSEKHRSLLG